MAQKKQTYLSSLINHKEKLAHKFTRENGIPRLSELKLSIHPTIILGSNHILEVGTLIYFPSIQ